MKNGYMYICVAGASLVAQMVKHPPAMQETQVQSLSWEETLEKEMVTHSSILPGGFHRQRSLVGYLRGVAESDTLSFYVCTWLHTFSHSLLIDVLFIFLVIFFLLI